LFNYAAGFLNRSPELQTRLVSRPGYREIRNQRDLGFIKVLAADVDTTDGTGATLALVDELHRHKSADLYGSLRDGLGKRGGSLVTISTAGGSEVSPLGFLRKAALELPELERHGAHTRAASSTFVMHEWAVPDGADCHDLDVVKQANPSSFVTLDALRARHDSPSMREAEWLRFACDRWVEDEDSQVVPVRIWDELARPGTGYPQRPVSFAFDVAPDGAAAIGVAGAAASDSELVHVELVELRPGTWWLPPRLAELAKKHRPYQVLCDPHFLAGSLVSEVERCWGKEVTKVSGSEHAEAFGMFKNAVMEGRLVHIGQDELQAALEGAGTRPVGEAVLWSPKSSSVSIAPLVSVTLALLGEMRRRRRPKPRIINLNDLDLPETGRTAPTVPTRPTSGGFSGD
jgi:hypothetical protein